ncbi:hypothetical protein Pmani_010757 [Petrolisthes manimaculis]|uniref:Uncharacterized protein n=1 Tax=Petrolisthes manimaculis TaxID=1843537 RepID=A0AAE1Q2F0_9EUCA|nr:hypothetical protein Pmani_010757 [Petrolisthes manimaculis]
MCTCGGRGEGGARCFFTHVCCCSLKITVFIVAIIDLLVFLTCTIILLLPWAFGELHFSRARNRYIGGIPRSGPLSVGLRFGVQFILSCVLIHGLRTKRRELLWGYIYARGLLMAGLVSIWINVLVEFPYPIVLAIATAVLLVALGIVVLTILTVRSYAIQLKAMAALSDSSLYYDRHEERILT